MCYPQVPITIALAVALVVAASGCDIAGPRGPAMVEVSVPDGFADLPVPPQNPLFADRVALGEKLFFDASLSLDGSVSCASCHLPEVAFADPARVSTGVDGRQGIRNSPSLLNVAYRTSFFWDGGAAFLEGQALNPIEDPREMDIPVTELIERLRANVDYAEMFASAFSGQGPSVQTLTYALAAYQRTLVSAPIALDRFRAGDQNAFTLNERRGLVLFEQHCQTCHAGPQLTNDQFMNNGVAVTNDDPGRERITHSAANRGEFRVPSLRGFARTAPYFHDGRHQTIEAVVGYYVGGGDGTTGQNPAVRPLPLTESEQADLAAFLRTLDDQAAPVNRSPNQ